MPEPVYHLRTGEQVAMAYRVDELPDAPEPTRRPRTRVKVFVGGNQESDGNDARQ